MPVTFVKCRYLTAVYALHCLLVSLVSPSPIETVQPLLFIEGRVAMTQLLLGGDTGLPRCKDAIQKSIHSLAPTAHLVLAKQPLCPLRFSSNVAFSSLMNVMNVLGVQESLYGEQSHVPRPLCTDSRSCFSWCCQHSKQHRQATECRSCRGDQRLIQCFTRQKPRISP